MCAKKEVTNEAVDFVRNNMDEMTLKQMGKLLDKTIIEVFRIVQEIRRTERKDQAMSEPKRESIPRDDAERPKMVRPPAVYNNRSHEDILDYWINLEV